MKSISLKCKASRRGGPLSVVMEDLEGRKVVGFSEGIPSHSALISFFKTIADLDADIWLTLSTGPVSAVTMMSSSVKLEEMGHPVPSEPEKLTVSEVWNMVTEDCETDWYDIFKDWAEHQPSPFTDMVKAWRSMGQGDWCEADLICVISTWIKNKYKGVMLSKDKK